MMSIVYYESTSHIAYYEFNKYTFILDKLKSSQDYIELLLHFIEIKTTYEIK